MEYNVFLETVKSLVQEELGEDYQIYRNRVMKNNDVFWEGLVICHKEEQTCPAIYLEESFREFQQGKEMQEIVFEVLMRYKTAKKLRWKNLDFSFEAVQSNIIYRLVNREKNRELLEDCPMVPFLDLAVTFHVVMDGAPEGEQAAVRITNEMMKNWGKAAEDLMELAGENTKKLLPARILTMKELLGQGIPEELLEEMEYEKLYILTNQYKIHGASAVLYPGVVQNFAEKIETNLYLLPSSIHEFILLPEENGMKKGALEEMVRSVNDTQLPKEEFLSNYVYYYERKSHELTKL